MLKINPSVEIWPPVEIWSQVTVMYLITDSDVKQKQKYRGMFETQKSRNKTSSGDVGLNIRTLASPKVGQDQVSGGVSVPCRHATKNIKGRFNLK